MTAVSPLRADTTPVTLTSVGTRLKRRKRPFLLFERAETVLAVVYLEDFVALGPVLQFEAHRNDAKAPSQLQLIEPWPVRLGTCLDEGEMRLGGDNRLDAGEVAALLRWLDAVEGRVASSPRSRLSVLAA